MKKTNFKAMKTTMNEDVRVKVAIYKPIFNKIADVVCLHVGIDRKKLGKRDRHRNYVKARKMICYYMNEFSNCPLGVIGYLMNTRRPYDHSNIHYMIKDYQNALYLHTPGGYFINEEQRAEDQRMRVKIKIVLPNIKMEEWLENFATSSGNFMMSEAV